MVIGGRNKYMINGNLAQQGRVQNLFHSVQLNVNNPHFLARAAPLAHPSHAPPATTKAVFAVLAAAPAKQPRRVRPPAARCACGVTSVGAWLRRRRSCRGGSPRCST